MLPFRRPRHPHSLDSRGTSVNNSLSTSPVPADSKLGIKGLFDDEEKVDMDVQMTSRKNIFPVYFVNLLFYFVIGF